MVRRILSGCVLALCAAACSIASDDADESSADVTAAMPWHSEAEVANAADRAKVQAYFDANVTRGSFVSDHDKPRETRQGSKVDIAYGIARAKKERGAIVLVNGRTESFSHYDEFVYDMHRRGWTIYMLDHRGQGHSSRLLDYATVGDDTYQKGHVDDFQDFVDDLAKFMDTVVKPDRVGKTAKLYGLAHSMGGAVMTLYAEQNPSAFSAIALSSPMHQIKEAWYKLDFAEFISFFTDTAYAAGTGPRGQSDDAFDGNELTGSRARFAAKQEIWQKDKSTLVGGPTYGWISNAISGMNRAKRHAGDIQVPVLLLEAGSDQIVAPDGQHDVCNGINAAHPGKQLCNLVVIDGSQHEGLIEVDAIRQRDLNLITQFYASH